MRGGSILQKKSLKMKTSDFGAKLQLEIRYF